MFEDWTAEVVGRMHAAGIKGKELADECKYSAAYLSTVLNGKKGTDDTKRRIFDGLERLEAKAALSTKDGVNDAESNDAEV